MPAPDPATARPDPATNPPDPAAASPLDGTIAAILGALERWRLSGQGVLAIGIDGHGASGKTTIARLVGAATGAALVHTDDFFKDETPPADAPLAAYYDWDLLRSQALEPLKRGQPATYPHRHWERPDRSGQQVTVAPGPLIVLEGVGAAAPQLHDLIDRTVLVQTPEDQRLERLHGRIPDEEWDDAWLAAERDYLDSIHHFDLTVSGGAR